MVASVPAWSATVINLASTDYPPYFSPSLPGDGVVGAITRAALAKHGYTLQLHYRPWARLMSEVEGGHFDGVMAVWYSPERAGYLLFSQPVANTVIGFYQRKDKPLNVQSLASLKPYLVGTVRGYKNPDAFDAARLDTEQANDDLSNLRKLAVGRLDLVLIDKALAHQLLPQLPGNMAARIHWQNPPVAVMPLHVGFFRGMTGAVKLNSDFNDGLAQLESSGELEKIFKRFHFAQ
ncbi:ABC transporter substrate-binding protein [Vogesella sp. LIG4]|uniref:substrate-binding periplasmic protein n=1 Tax=Vogesella sp. LIG4 TaxID=1192162 RepID=UPI00081F9516|nr:transporter substrate-binding domain-containing protein [Vogesella sp. LIG4]SCK22532.1 polar amino acid transport system substrate-binding protein [Vogesella sp. LIG4]